MVSRGEWFIFFVCVPLALIAFRSVLRWIIMRQQLRREEQEEIRRAIESVRVYEDFIEEMQIRARENGTQNEAAQLEERRQTILQSVVITKYRPRKEKEEFEVIDLSGEVKGKDNEVIDLSGEGKGKAKNPNYQDENHPNADGSECYLAFGGGSAGVTSFEWD